MCNFKEKAREEGIDVYKQKIGQNKIKCQNVVQIEKTNLIDH